MEEREIGFSGAYGSLGRIFPGVRDVVAAESGGALLQARHEGLCKHCFRHDFLSLFVDVM